MTTHQIAGSSTHQNVNKADSLRASAVQKDGMNIVLVDPDAHGCEHNIEEV